MAEEEDDLKCFQMESKHNIWLLSLNLELGYEEDIVTVSFLLEIVKWVPMYTHNEYDFLKPVSYAQKWGRFFFTHRLVAKISTKGNIDKCNLAMNG